MDADRSPAALFTEMNLDSPLRDHPLHPTNSPWGWWWWRGNQTAVEVPHFKWLHRPTHTAAEGEWQAPTEAQPVARWVEDQMPAFARAARDWAMTERPGALAYLQPTHRLQGAINSRAGRPFNKVRGGVDSYDERNAPHRVLLKLAWRKKLHEYARGIRYWMESRGYDVVLPDEAGPGAGYLRWATPEGAEVGTVGEARARRDNWEAAVRAAAVDARVPMAARTLLRRAIARADWRTTQSARPAASLRHALRAVLAETDAPAERLATLPEAVRAPVRWEAVEWPSLHDTLNRAEEWQATPLTPGHASEAGDPAVFEAYMARYPASYTPARAKVFGARMTPTVREALLKTPPGYPPESRVGNLPLYSGPVPGGERGGPSAWGGAIGAALTAAPAIANDDWEEVLPRAFAGGIAGGIAGGRIGRALDLRRAARARTRAQQAEGPYFGLMRPEAARLLQGFGMPGHFAYADMGVRRMLHEVGRPVPREATWEEALSRFDDFYGEDPAAATAVAQRVKAENRWMEPLPREDADPTRREFLGAMGAGAAGLAGVGRGAPPAEGPGAPGMGEFLSAYNRWKYSPDVLASVERGHAALTAREQAGWRGATERAAAPAGRPSRPLGERFRPLFTGDAMDLTPGGMAFSGPVAARGVRNARGARDMLLVHGMRRGVRLLRQLPRPIRDALVRATEEPGAEPLDAAYARWPQIAREVLTGLRLDVPAGSTAGVPQQQAVRNLNALASAFVTVARERPDAVLALLQTPRPPRPGLPPEHGMSDQQAAIEAAERRMTRRVGAGEIPGPELGATRLEAIAPITLGAGGAALGAATGDDEDRLRNALLGGAAGLGLGAIGAAFARRRGRSQRGTTALGPAVDVAEPVAGERPLRVPESQEAYAALEQAGRPRPEPVGGRASLPQVVRADDYVNFAKFDLDPTGEQRLREEVERLVVEVGIHPKRRISWAETRRLANDLGIDAHGLRDSEVNTRLGGPEMLAIRNLISANLYAMERWAHSARQPRRTLAEKDELMRRINAAELQNRALLERFIKARTETGRDLNNLKIVANRTLDPVYWVTLAQRYTGGEPKVKLPGGRTVTQAEIQTTVTRLATERNREALVQYMMGLRRAGPVEKLQTLWKAGLLTNPKTHAVNIISNTTMAVLEGMKENVGLIADRALGLAAAGVGHLPGGTPLKGPMPRTMSPTTWRVVRESARGALAGLREARQVLRGAPLPEALERYDIRRETNYDNAFLNAYTKGVFRSLEAADRVFRGFALRGSLTHQAQVLARAEGKRGVEYRQRVEELVRTPTDEMALQAIADAEVATFKEQTTLSEWASPMARHKVGGFVLPFSRTPSAVATSVGRYTPFGLLGAAWDAGAVLKAAYRGQRVPEIQQRAARRFGRAATGSLFIWLGYQLAKDDRMTGGYPTTRQTERELWEATGRTPNSIRVGDTWYQVGRLSPVGNLLAVGANLFEIERRRETPASLLEQGTEAAASMAKTVADQPFLTGLRDVTEAAQDPLEAGARVARNFAGSFIPAGVAAAARATDPFVRDTRSLESSLQARVPGVSRQAAPRVDTFGEIQRRPGGPISRALAEMLNPLAPRPDLRATDPVRRELWDVGWAPARERRDPRETAWAGAERQAAIGPAIREATEATMQTGQYGEAQLREAQARTDAKALRAAGVRLPEQAIVDALLAEDPDFVSRADQLRRATGRARGLARREYLGEP